MNNILPLKQGRKTGKSKSYLQFIVWKSCCVCGGEPVQAHHEPPKGNGRNQTTDYQTVPLCQDCHEKRHRGKKDEMQEIKEICEKSKEGYMVEYLRRMENN